MPRFDMPKARSTRKRPGVEALEARELLARIPLAPIPSGANILNLPAVQYALNQLYNPDNPKDDITEGNGTVIASPTPSVHEVHREFFELKASANYTITAPRFVSPDPSQMSGQLETIHAASTYGSSNQFLVGRPQLILFPSTDSNKPATGIINVLASNFLQSGASIILDLTEAALLPNGAVDTTVTSTSTNGFNDTTGEIVPGDHFERSATGLPEAFTWKLDPTSGSVYTGSTGNTPNPAYAAYANPYYAAGQTPPPTTIPQFLPGPTGSGTGAGLFNLSYVTDANPASGTTGSGNVKITAMGLTNLPGINNTAARNFS